MEGSTMDCNSSKLHSYIELLQCGKRTQKIRQLSLLPAVLCQTFHDKERWDKSHHSVLVTAEKKLSNHPGGNPGDWMWDLTPFERTYMTGGPIRWALSPSHKELLIAHSRGDAVLLLKLETDLETTFLENQKDCILVFAHKGTICNRYQEISYKIITRWYKMQNKLAKLFPC